MKKILFSLFLFSGLFSAFPIQADMDEMFEMMSKELRQRSLEFSKKGKTETYVIKYAVAADGSVMHFGIWSDCIIGTVVGNAPNVGAQAIMLGNGVIFDQSTAYTKKKDYFINKYNWGKVTSSDKKQVVESK